MDTTVIARTSKGHRIFLDYLTQRGYSGRYDVHYSTGLIVVEFHDEGKHKLVLSKGGVCDLEGKRVTTWAQGATTAHITYNPCTIAIRK